MGINEVIQKSKIICWYPSSAIDIEKVILYHNSVQYKSPDLYIMSDTFIGSQLNYERIEQMINSVRSYGFDVEIDALSFNGYIYAKNRFFNLLILLEKNEDVYSTLSKSSKCRHFIIHRPIDGFILNDIPYPRNGANSFLKYGFIGSSGKLNDLTYCPVDWRKHTKIIKGPLIFQNRIHNEDIGYLVRIS